MINYTSRPGSFGARLLEHLTAVGGTMTMAEMAQGFAKPRKNIDGHCGTIIRHGLLVECGERDGKRVFGLPGADPTVIAPPPSAGLTLGGQTKPMDQTLKKKAGTRKANVQIGFEPLNVPAATGPLVGDLPPPPIAALWEDGDICLYSLQINADESATMGEAHARRLHKFLERVFGPTV